MAEKTTVLFCNCAYYDLVSDDKKTRVIKALQDASVSFEAVPDLCALAAKKDESLKRFADNTSLKIIACFPRTIKWLFNRADAPIDSKNVQVLNMRTQSADDIVAALTQSDIPTGGTKIDLEKSDPWVPWFPVIDYDRCISCKQCQNFCLFGVYQTLENGKVEVVNPSNCKTNCPACARVCPQAAIIFPKYDKSPINGDQVKPEHLKEQNMQIDLSDRLQGNIHDMIRNRTASRKRFSADDDSTAQDDRIEQLRQLQQQLDIPTDVIENLSNNKDNNNG